MLDLMFSLSLIEIVLVLETPVALFFGLVATTFGGALSILIDLVTV
jgi:hypothetical protein